MTSEVKLLTMKKLCLYNVIIHRNFYKYQLMNECAKLNSAKIPESCSHRVLFLELEELMFLISIKYFFFNTTMLMM